MKRWPEGGGAARLLPSLMFFSVGDPAETLAPWDQVFWNLDREHFLYNEVIMTALLTSSSLHHPDLTLGQYILL